MWLPGTYAGPRVEPSHAKAASKDRNEHRNEHGLSLVEILVATTLLAIGIVGASSLLAASSRTIATADHRAQATRLAVSEMEAIRAYPYSRIIVDGGQPVTAQADATSPLIPKEALTIDGTEYVVVREIAWGSIGSGPTANEQAYKVLTVSIYWKDASGNHEIRHESGLYPSASLTQAGGR